MYYDIAWVREGEGGHVGSSEPGYFLFLIISYEPLSNLGPGGTHITDKSETCTQTVYRIQ